MSKVCDVYVKLPHGVVIGDIIPAKDGVAFDCAAHRIILEHGFNEDVPRDRIERWLAQNKNLAAVKRGDIRIVDRDVIAVDSSNRK